MFPAVAVIQSLPIFDETRLFSLPLPAVLGHSLSFSYTLQLYLVLMFLGETSTNTLLRHSAYLMASDLKKKKKKTIAYRTCTLCISRGLESKEMKDFYLLAATCLPVSLTAAGL